MLFLLAGAGDSGDTFRLPNITLLHFNEREQNRALIPFLCSCTGPCNEGYWAFRKCTVITDKVKRILFSLECFLPLKWRKIGVLKCYFTRVWSNQLQLSSPSSENKKLWCRDGLTVTKSLHWHLNTALSPYLAASQGDTGS